jgi:hypothetical protein
MSLGLTACVLLMVLGVLLAVWQSLVPGLGMIALGAVCIIPILLASAPIFLAVDAARNLRAIRYGRREG